MDWIVLLVMTVASLAASDEVGWLRVLSELDAARGEAFAGSDPTILDDVYASTSPARQADAELIADYARRGGRVVDVEMVVLSCAVRHRSADRVSLDVVDRLAPTHVEWDDGSTRALPRDVPTRRQVTLVRTAEGWRILSATPS